MDGTAITETTSHKHLGLTLSRLSLVQAVAVMLLICYSQLQFFVPDLKLFTLVGRDRSFRMLLGPSGLN